MAGCGALAFFGDPLLLLRDLGLLKSTEVEVDCRGDGDGPPFLLLERVLESGRPLFLDCIGSRTLLKCGCDERS